MGRPSLRTKLWSMAVRPSHSSSTCGFTLIERRNREQTLRCCPRVRLPGASTRGWLDERCPATHDKRKHQTSCAEDWNMSLSVCGAFRARNGKSAVAMRSNARPIFRAFPGRPKSAFLNEVQKVLGQGRRLACHRRCRNRPCRR